MQVMAAANARAAAGSDVLHLEVGEPGDGAPESAIRAAQRAMSANPLGYTEALGLPALRQRISKHYEHWYGVNVPSERIAITAGASGALVLAFIAAFEAGDRVALAEPGYPAYRNILAALDIQVVPLPVGEAERFQPTPEIVAGCADLDGFIVASPANPTGTMLQRSELKAIAQVCAEQNIQLISDEIYHGISYTDPAVSIVELSDDAVLINSFSKFFCMTGWRIGWMVLPDHLVDPVERLAQNLFISPSAIGQHAALAAFEDEEQLHTRIAGYRRNREHILSALSGAGINRFAPADGAFYVYADISDFSSSSPELCRQILEETGVAITPGLDFDQRHGNRFVRLSFAGDEQEVSKAASRLESWFKARR